MLYPYVLMIPRRSYPVVRVTDLASGSVGTSHRVSALVDGAPVWFESTDVALRAAPEALGTAFLIPALLRGARLALDAPLCPRWCSNVAQLLRTFHRWWGTPELPPAADVAPPAPVGAATGTALCFSGGVDSFYTLLCSGQSIEWLATVHGFDIPLGDVARMSALSTSLREISLHLGVKPVVIRTNLREHPLVREASWERTHGGALAAIGHLLDGSIGRLLISSSIPLDSRREWWGSHWKTDALWSSSRLAVVNFGADARRVEKLRAIARQPLVQRHLRVCWENRTLSSNCSHCEKCLSAMLVLVELGLLDRFPVFEGADHLIERLDALPSMRHLRRSFVEMARSERLPPELARAVRDLIRRTRRVQSLPVRARRYLVRTVLSWSRAGGR